MNVADPHAVAAVMAAVFGLPIGSFVGVVADRVPRKESIVRPSSHCTSCAAPLRTIDNVRSSRTWCCAGVADACGVHIPPRDLYVELTTALLFAAVAWRAANLLGGAGLLPAGRRPRGPVGNRHRPQVAASHRALRHGRHLCRRCSCWRRGRRIAFTTCCRRSSGRRRVSSVFLAIWFVSAESDGFR